MEHGTFIGWTGDDVLHSLYRIADLCLVPSIYEPFGLVALEAMASGCPCIVADTGGLREVVPGGRRVGLRFRARDSAALARMAQKLLTDDALRDRLVAQAREHVLQFDWADVARQTEAVYEDLRGARVCRGPHEAAVARRPPTAPPRPHRSPPPRRVPTRAPACATACAASRARSSSRAEPSTRAQSPTTHSRPIVAAPDSDAALAQQRPGADGQLPACRLQPRSVPQRDAVADHEPRAAARRAAPRRARAARRPRAARAGAARARASRSRDAPRRRPRRHHRLQRPHGISPFGAGYDGANPTGPSSAAASLRRRLQDRSPEQHPPRLNLPSWPADRPLREWQQAAAAAVFSHPADAFLASATPASGKTTFGLHVAHRMLAERRVARVAVVAPTTHIARQWTADAARYGLDLEPNRPNAAGPEPRDRHGVAVTYQTVAAGPAVHRRRCAEAPTLLIADEPHHMGDEAAWGRSTVDAFSRARFKLLLSGTPFRTDDTPIPWVSYDADGFSEPDFAYGYTDALLDHVCRPVTFHLNDGDMEWMSDGRRRSADFTVGLPAAEAARRLRTALDPDGDWIAHVMRDAVLRLVRVRAGSHPDAGGLVVAADKEHADALAERLARVAGERPEVVTSDAPDASARIARFAAGRGTWLVSVLMVSEGVDIPRLRVGVYATSARTELFFRQVVGRFTRRTPAPREQMSHVFLPADPTLKRLAAQVEEERRHALTLEPTGEQFARAGRARPFRAGRRVPRAVVERARRGRDAPHHAAGRDDGAVRGRPGAVRGAGRVHGDRAGRERRRAVAAGDRDRARAARAAARRAPCAGLRRSRGSRGNRTRSSTRA